MIYIPDDNDNNKTDDLNNSNNDSETVMTPDENSSEETPVEAETSVDSKTLEEGDDSQEVPAEEGTSEAAPEATAAGTDDRGRTLYNVKCSNCGNDTQVPFQPSQGRPVYCRDCFMKMKRDR